MFHLAKGSAARQRLRTVRRWCGRIVLTLALAAVTYVSAAAQGHGGGGRPGGPGGGGGGRGAGFPGGGPGAGGPAAGGPGAGGPGAGGSKSPARNPMQRGPAGRWWDDAHYAGSVGLTGDQQRRMDGVFAENRGALVSGLDTLHKAEARLSAVSGADHPSESALNAEIQNVAQARADLEKANAHLLLQIRNEMTQEQLNRLEKLQ